MDCNKPGSSPMQRKDSEFVSNTVSYDNSDFVPNTAIEVNSLQPIPNRINEFQFVPSGMQRISARLQRNTMKFSLSPPSPTECNALLQPSLSIDIATGCQRAALIYSQTTSLSPWVRITHVCGSSENINSEIHLSSTISVSWKDRSTCNAVLFVSWRMPF